MRDRRSTRAGVVIAAFLLAFAVAILAWPRGEVPISPAPAVSAASPDDPPTPPTLCASPRARASAATNHEAAASEGGKPAVASDNDLREQALAASRADIEARRWASARDRIDALGAANPDPDAATRKALDTLREEFRSGRQRHLGQIAVLRFPEILRARIDARVADPSATYDSVREWLRRECFDETFELLCKELQEADPTVTREEVFAMWDERRRTDASWRPLIPSTVESLPEAPSPDAKAVTRESWWAAASKEQRASECTSTFVVKSGLFEVERNWYR